MHPSEVTLLNIYGATEVAADVAFSVVSEEDISQSAPPYLSVGEPLPGVSIVLVSSRSDGTLVVSEEEGAIVVTGCQVAADYAPLGAPSGSSTESTPTGFWWITTTGFENGATVTMSTMCQPGNSTWAFRTGDTARRGDRRKLDILGRSDQIVKIWGHKVSLLQKRSWHKRLWIRCGSYRLSKSRRDNSRCSCQ